MFETSGLNFADHICKHSMKENIMKHLLYSVALLSSLLFSGTISAASLSLSGTIFDHSIADPDFQDGISGVTTGMLAPTLGLDGLPEYVGVGGYGAVDSAATFDHWWEDHGPGTSKAVTLTLDETGPGTGIFSYSDSSFFPIDGELLGNEGLAHNYHFAMHLEGTTSFELGDSFDFTGDDDLWVFIDDKLVMDLGGVHGPSSASTSAADLLAAGLSTGTDYDIDIFFAERHTTESNFHITTSFHVDSPTVPAPAPLALIAIGLMGLTVRKRLFK